MHELDPAYLRLQPSSDAGPVDKLEDASAKADDEGRGRGRGRGRARINGRTDAT